MTDALTTAVHRLTRETRTKVIQDGGKVATVTHDPLLVQLANAVASSLSKDSSGSGKANTGLILNSEALYESGIIRSAIGDWCRLAGVRPVRDMRADLIAWAEAFTKLDPAKWEAEAAGYVRRMNDWEQLITRLLYRPVQVDLSDPCTVCGAKSYGKEDENGNPYEVPYPVFVQYSKDDPFASAKALCRRCSAVWDGAEAISELMGELREKEVG